MNTLKFAARLKAARKSAGYKTSKEFVTKHDIPASTYSQHESGQRYPSDEIIQRYSLLCHVNFEWLKTGSGDPFAGTADNNNLSQKQEIIADEMLDLRSGIIDKSNLRNAPSIDSELLAKILDELMCINAELSKPVSNKKLGSITAKIYEDIISIETDPKYQTKMVKPAVSSFKYLYSK